jgi:hypothetical protein
MLQQTSNSLRNDSVFVNTPAALKQNSEAVPFNCKRVGYKPILESASGELSPVAITYAICADYRAAANTYPSVVFLRPTILRPGVKAAVHLHHLPLMLRAIPPAMARLLRSRLHNPSTVAASWRPPAIHARPPGVLRPASAQTVRPSLAAAEAPMRTNQGLSSATRIRLRDFIELI